MFNNHLPFNHLRAFSTLPLESCALSLVSCFLYNCRGSSTNRPVFLQNKPNFQDTQMNVSANIIKDYENKSDPTLGENKPNSKPIQTQTNPICQKPKMNINSILTKDYENIRHYTLPKNKPKTNPILSEAKNKRNHLSNKDLPESTAQRQ